MDKVEYTRQGKIDDALAQYQTALRIYKEIGNRRGEGLSLRGIGSVYQQTSKLDDALMVYRNSLNIYRDIEDKRGQAESLRGIGSSCKQMGHLLEAKGYYTEALELFKAMEMPEADKVQEELNQVNHRLAGQ